MPRFAVIRVNGPAFDPAKGRREQDGWDEHAEFMDALAAEGFVFLGGPFGDSERVLLIVDAASEAEVEARLAEDPWTPMGILRTVSIDRWDIWVSGGGS
jgi:uncharacterized protein YciI